MQKTAFTTLLFMWAMQQSAQVTPEQIGHDQTDATPGTTISISYKKFQLPNGLTVLIHEDHSDPIVYVDVTYHVGSAREQEGRSGFAHFFEHMMFQGSKHVADDQHFKIVTEAGGALNGTTNTDRTNYFETVPNNQLEKMLWLEADRMGFLLDSVTQKKFEVQRATVKNERGQRYDNAPYGLVGEKTGEALYPEGHPYSWTTIGYIEDLNRVDVNDLKRFYMRWYGPNNAVLTVAGDVNAEETFHLVEKYFGSIQKGPDVTPQTLAPVKLAQTRYISYEDNIKFPSLNYVYPTVNISDKDDAPLNVLATILTGSQGSPFYKAFVETGKAVSVTSYQNSRELAGQFHLSVRANPNAALADVNQEVKRVFSEWEKKGVSDDDLIKFKAQFKSDLYNQLSTVQGKGTRLAYDYTLRGDADYLQKEIEKYMAVTNADVMRVYQTYIKGQPAVILSCVPKGKGDLRMQADNWKMYARKVEPESAEYKNLQFKDPMDAFDRSTLPKVSTPIHVEIKDIYRMMVEGTHIPIMGIYDDETPKVNILITFRAGHRYEPKGKSGLADLTAHLLDKSSLRTPAAEIENKLDRLGSNVSFISGEEEVSINIQALKENIDATLKIVEESLFEPKFDSVEFENEKKQLLDRIAQSQTNASDMANMAFRSVLYNAADVMSYPPSGTSETVKSLNLKDVKNYYSKLVPALSNVVLTGDLEFSTAYKKLSFLSKTNPKKDTSLVRVHNLPIEKTKIYFVDKKNAAQSEIRVGYLAMPYSSLGNYYKATVANFSFSGAFNSRINNLLREVKGWTYGVRGNFSGTFFAGPFTLSGGFKSNTTDSALVEIFKEFKKYTEEGITDAELAFTKNAIIQNDAIKYESPLQKLLFEKRILDYNLPKEFVTQQTELLNKLNKAELNSLIKRIYPQKRMIIVVVGDKANNLEKVKKLGFEVQEMDVNGKFIN